MPVDIVALAATFADVERADWPMTSVDGITVNCADDRPQIFFHGDPDDARTRFTIAHELGHAVLPWHIGTAECAIPAGPWPVRSAVEREADEFAAELLLPTDWLRQLIRDHAGDLNKVLSEVALARVSATASLIAVSNVLPEGWALQVNNNSIVVPHQFGVTMTRAEANQAAFDSGFANVNQQSILWWRLFEVPASPQKPADKDAAYALLDSVLSKYGATERDRRSVDGSVSAVLGGLGGMLDIDSAFGYLLYRIGRSAGWRDLCNENEFRAWLAWKVNQGASRFRTWY